MSRQVNFRLCLGQDEAILDKALSDQIEFALYVCICSSARQSDDTALIGGWEARRTVPDPVFTLACREYIEIEHDLPLGRRCAVGLERRAPPDASRMDGILPEIVPIRAELGDVWDPVRRVEDLADLLLKEREPWIRCDLVHARCVLALTHWSASRDITSSSQPNSGSAGVVSSARATIVFTPRMRLVSSERPPTPLSSARSFAGSLFELSEQAFRGLVGRIEIERLSQVFACDFDIPSRHCALTERYVRARSADGTRLFEQDIYRIIHGVSGQQKARDDVRARYQREQSLVKRLTRRRTRSEVLPSRSQHLPVRERNRHRSSTGWARQHAAPPVDRGLRSSPRGSPRARGIATAARGPRRR